MPNSGATPLPQPTRMLMTEKDIQLDINPDWEIRPETLKEKLDQKADFLLLDVRMQREWDFCRLGGATLLPLGQLHERATAELAAWKNKPVIVYCHHGVRSLNAAVYLRQQGFADVKSLAGGIEAWSLLVDAQVPRY